MKEESAGQKNQTYERLVDMGQRVVCRLLSTHNRKELVKVVVTSHHQVICVSTYLISEHTTILLNSFSIVVHFMSMHFTFKHACT